MSQNDTQSGGAFLISPQAFATGIIVFLALVAAGVVCLGRYPGVPEEAYSVFMQQILYDDRTHALAMLVALLLQQSALFVNLAATYALLGRDREAAESVARAIRIDPLNHTALGNLRAFCRGRTLDTSRWDPVVLRRSEETFAGMAELLDQHRAGEDTAALCPSPDDLR